MEERYTLRPDPAGFTILDLTTGRPAQIATLPQTGLSRDDAEYTVTLFNQRNAALQAAVQAS